MKITITLSILTIDSFLAILKEKKKWRLWTLPWTKVDCLGDWKQDFECPLLPQCAQTLKSLSCLNWIQRHSYSLMGLSVQNLLAETILSRYFLKHWSCWSFAIKLSSFLNLISHCLALLVGCDLACRFQLVKGELVV